MKRLLLLLIACLASPCFAEVVIIVHPSNAAALERSDVARIYLGKSKKFPGGGQAIPLNHKEGSATKSTFDSQVLKKSSSQLKAYWSKLVFTGKGSPPKEISSEEEILQLVASNPNFIGYVDASKVNDSVKAIPLS